MHGSAARTGHPSMRPRSKSTESHLSTSSPAEWYGAWPHGLYAPMASPSAAAQQPLTPEPGWGLELPYSIVCRGGAGCDLASNASTDALRTLDVVIAVREKPVASFVRALGNELPMQRLALVTIWV